MRLTIILLSGLLLSTGAGAAVYKWVDEDGRVHYGDRPESQRAAPVQMPPAQPSGSVAPPVDRQSRQRRLVDTLEEDRLRRLEERAKAETERADRSRRCAWARDRMRRYESAGFLYDLDERGERRALSDAERRRALGQAQAEIDKWCG